MKAPTVYHIYDRGAAQGPFSMAEIARRWKTNQISRDALYFTEGWPDWKPLIASTEMAAFFQPAKKPSVPPKTQLVRLVFLIVVMFFLLKGCVFNDHSEERAARAARVDAHDYRDGFNVGLEVGKKNGLPGSGYSVPTAEGLRQLSAFSLIGHSPADKQEFMRGWRDGYKMGFQEVSKKAW